MHLCYVVSYFVILYLVDPGIDSKDYFISIQKEPRYNNITYFENYLVSATRRTSDFDVTGS